MQPDTELVVKIGAAEVTVKTTGGMLNVCATVPRHSAAGVDWHQQRTIELELEEQPNPVVRQQ